jgi:general secretion pathway protein M
VSQATGRRRCLLAWGLAVLIPAILIVGVGWPWLNRVSSLDMGISNAEEQLTRYKRLIATLPGLQAELEQVLSNEDVKAFYYDAATPQLAGAQMQRELQDMVKQAGARLVSAQILPSDAEKQPPKVSIRAQIQGGTDALLDVLYQIEHARPFLFVDQLSVRATARPALRRTPRLRGRRLPARQQPQGQLTVRLDVFGYALGERR